MKAGKSGIDKIRYDRIAGFYDQFESPVELLAFARWRKLLFERMKPKKGELVLEIGAGTGKNISFYGEGNYVAFDISEKMISRAKVRSEGRSVELLIADAEYMPFKEGVFDTIFAAFTFCSVENPVNGLREARRVLKDGGRAFFLEHMLPKNRIAQVFFNLLNPVARIMGPEINRRTDDNIRMAGFRILGEEYLFTSVFRLFEAIK